MTKQQTDSLKLASACGFLAALLAALLWFSLLNVPFLPILFGISVSIPIFFSIFAANLRRGIAAACFAAFLLCLILPLSAALPLAAFFFLPALLTGWLIGLKTPASMPFLPVLAPKGAARRKTAPERGHSLPGSSAPLPAAAQFYPLAAAVFQLALAVAFVTVGVLFYVFSAADSAQVFAAAAARIMQFMQENSLYDISKQGSDMALNLRRLLPVLFAVSLALYGFLFQLAALYCAMRLAAAKGLLARPLSYWPAQLRMPPLALLLFLLLWVGSYFANQAKAEAGASLALCLNVILAVLAAGFCVSGLAVLHQAARGPWLWLRIILYICLFSVVLTPITFFGLVIMGLFATPFSSTNQNGLPPSAQN